MGGCSTLVSTLGGVAGGVGGESEAAIIEGCCVDGGGRE